MLFNWGDRKEGKYQGGHEGFDLDEWVSRGTGDGDKEMHKVGGKVRRLLGMRVCSSGKMKLQRFWSVSTEVVIKVLGQVLAAWPLVACF